MSWWRRRRLYIDDLPKTHDFRFAMAFLVGLVVIFGALYAVGYAVAGDKLPAGTTVADVDVGGMSPDQARTVLQERLAPRLQESITATAGGKDYKIDPQRAGLTFDVDATLDKALGGSPWDPRHMLHVLLGGDKLQPVVDVDGAELVSTLSRVNNDIARKPVDSTVSFASGRPEVKFGHAGRALDFQRSGDRLEDALLEGEQHVALPVKSVQPRVTGIKATRFVDTVARKALRRPVSIRVADATMTLRTSEFARALKAVPSDGGLRLDVDGDTLMKRAKESLRTLPHHPQNAKISFRSGHPVVIPGTSGVTVAKDDLAKAVLRAVSRSGDERVVHAKAQPENPLVTTQELRMLQIKERVASAQVQFSFDPRLEPTAVLRQLDGALIKPGGSFSFLARVDSRRSPGASSLVASMLYDAAFSVGLGTPEHTPERIYSRTFAPGFDAHVEPPSVDLVLSNASPYGVYVRASVDAAGRRSAVARLELWSTRYWRVSAKTSGRYNIVAPDVIRDESKSCVERRGVPGFEVDVTRMLRRDGHLRTEVTHARYAPLDAVDCR